MRDNAGAVLYVPDMSRNDLNEIEPALLDFPTAARWLHVTESWLRRSVTANEVPHRRLGRKVRFSLDDLHAIVAASAVSPAAVSEGLRPSKRRTA